jgi:chromate reductase
LEEATVTEGTDLWLGKPCVVGVLMHSVGGKGVLSRLQGVLNTYGLFIPPMSGFLYSVVNQLALKGEESPLSEDLWRIDDLEVVCHNLLEACRYPRNWRGWPVNRTSFDKVWLEG